MKELSELICISIETLNLNEVSLKEGNLIPSVQYSFHWSVGKKIILGSLACVMLAFVINFVIQHFFMCLALTHLRFNLTWSQAKDRKYNCGQCNIFYLKLSWSIDNETKQDLKIKLHYFKDILRLYSSPFIKDYN